MATALLALVVGACSGSRGSTGSPPPAHCVPKGPSLSVLGKNITFTPKVLCAPADQALTITFDNEDAAIAHNVTIASRSGDFGDPSFRGQVTTGPNATIYQVAALPAGVYRLRCDIHPQQMTGYLVVAAGP